MVNPVKLTSQTDVGGGVLDGAQVDKVEDMDFHVRQTLVSILVEMSRHFVFFDVMHYLVEVTLESLFWTVLCLTYILFLAFPAGDAVDKVVAFARHVVFSAVFPARHSGHYMAFHVQQWTVPALTVGAFLVWSFGRFSILQDGGELT